MTLIVFGIILFVLPHFFSSFMPGARDRLMARYGEGLYKGVYSAVTAIGFLLLVTAYFMDRGSGNMLYTPMANMKHATMGLATLGFICIAAGHGKSHIRLWLQNPFSIGIALWAIGHLLSVGQVAADWFYIALLAVALVDIGASMAQGKKPDFQATWRSDIIAVLAGLVVTALLIFLFHPYVLGVKLAG